MTLPQGAIRRRDRFFYSGMAIVAAVIVFAGFSRTYYLKGLFGTPVLSRLAHVHGFLFTSWIVLLLVQVSLVAAGRTDVHRRLGVAGGVLAGLMVAAGTMMGINAARLGHAPVGGVSPLSFLAIPLFDILVFAILVAAGFYYRRQPAIHKRLMLVATITLLPAAISRLPFAFIQVNGPLAFFGLADLILVACIAYDTATHRRLNPAYLWGGLLLVLSHPLRLVIGGTGMWLVFAHWLTGV